MKFRKIINPNLSKKSHPQTEKRKAASRNAGVRLQLLQNVHHFKKGDKPFLGRKHTEATKKKISITKFGKKTNLGKKHTEETKLKCTIINVGRRPSDKSISVSTKRFILNNPMKNPELAKKNGTARRKILDGEILNYLINEFNSGKSISQLKKELKIGGLTITKNLKDNGIRWDANERRRISSLNNPNVIKNWIKPKLGETQ